MKFLEAVAERFARRSPLERICFVFPNRRSATFFKRHLGIASGKPVFVPNVLTIDELFVRIAGVEETKEKARLLDILYREYVQLMPFPEEKGPETFDQFIYWGDILLGDFDDLDKYLVEVRRLLVNLHDLKALSVDYDFLTDDQKAAVAAFCNSFFAGEQVPGGMPGGSRRSFSELWNILYPLYEAFRARLRERGLAYAGMIYRSVAESLPSAGTLLPQYDEIVFIGLNALNACEKRLLDHFRKEGRADFYWDFFGPMVTDPDNPAGRFIRENVKRFPSREPFDAPALDPGRQHVEVISVPSAVGQTRKAMQVLAQLQRDGAMEQVEETAVVLPDENLLFPMLGAIPAGIAKVNVTMGYSLSASSGATLFQLLERLQSGRRLRGEAWSFYHRDVIDLLEHPYFAALADPAAVAALKQGIRENNRVFVPAAELTGCGDIFALFFQPVLSTGAIPAWLRAILETAQTAQTPLEREFICHYHQAVCDLERVGLDLEGLEPKTWYRLLAQYIALVKVSFEGEPLSGLQVMGPLETRALDFRNVIMLSVGEGIFPSRTVRTSFIPYNLRVGFGLPTYELQDAIWAYYFYRCICRAERIFLLYDSRTEGLQSGEESRYIKQLRYLYEVPLTEKVATCALSASGLSSAPPRVEKGAEVLAELEQRFLVERKPFSATALNSFLDCPLRFYYEHVKGLKEQDDVVEELDAGLFGTIYHRVMERLYKPFVGGELRPSAIEALRRDRRRLDALIAAAFAENRIREIEGENLILRDLIRHFVRRTLEVDATVPAGPPLHLLGTEERVGSTLSLSGDRTVRLFGIIDRLDSLEPGVVRLVDYKSGSIAGKDACGDVERLFDASLTIRRPSVGFQLYFYALLKIRTAGDPGLRFDPCIYSLRSIFSTEPFKSYRLDPAALTDFEARLAALVESIFDPAQPFAGSVSEDVCKYCNFKRLCNRR